MENHLNIPFLSLGTPFMPQIPVAFVFSHRVTDSYLVLGQIFPFEKEKSTISAPTLAAHSVCAYLHLVIRIMLIAQF